MNMLAFYYVELCLVDYEVLKYSSSMLAAAAVYLARNTLKSGEEAEWNATLRHHSGYEEAELK
jgi:cyclin B